MGRLMRQDRIILEGLDDKYGKDMLANAIMQIANCTSCDTEGCASCSTTPEMAVMDFIQYLEGARIRMREIHWQAERKSTHELSNDYIGILEDTEDEIAEDLMGVCGYRIKVGQITPVMPEASDIESLIRDVKDHACCLLASLEDCENCNFVGISNTLEDLLHKLNVGRYLSSMK